MIMRRRPIRYRYGAQPSQFCELSLPDSAPPHHVAALIHGGFWQLPWGLELMAGAVSDLTGRGLAVWNLEYRRIGEPGAGWPGTFNDVLAGFDSLATLPESVDLILDSASAAGHSAGGHLALWLGAERGPGTGYPAVVAQVVALAAVGDLRTAWADDVGGEAVQALMGGSPQSVPDLYELASPIERLPLGVRQLMVHGERDRVVPSRFSRAYAAAAAAAGDDAETLILPGTGHMDVINPKSRSWKLIAERLLSTTNTQI